MSIPGWASTPLILNSSDCSSAGWLWTGFPSQFVHLGGFLGFETLFVSYCDRLPTGCRLDVDWMSYYCMLAIDGLETGFTV
jgi:hypothetical protein